MGSVPKATFDQRSWFFLSTKNTVARSAFKTTLASSTNNIRSSSKLVVVVARLPYLSKTDRRRRHSLSFSIFLVNSEMSLDCNGEVPFLEVSRLVRARFFFCMTLFKYG